jgi:hypothetical protein
MSALFLHEWSHLWSIAMRSNPVSTARLVQTMVLVALAYMALLAVVVAEPPQNADRSLAPWFKGLAAPDGTGCCTMADCRKTTSRLTRDGYEAMIDDAWVTVPWDRVLPITENPTGQAVVCNAPRTKIILCFVRPPDA